MKSWVLLLLVLHIAHCKKYFADDKLKVALYYEALCPFCMSFITKQLYPTFNKIGASYLELELIPFGNADMRKVNGRWTFECQHGPNECAINKLEACGIVRSADQTAQLNYVNCVESKADHSVRDLEQLSKCATHLNVPSNDVLTCAQGAEGDYLLAGMGEKQGELIPEPDYVPWLLFNDQPHDSTLESKAQSNMFNTTCELLKNKPAACNL